MKNLLLFLTLVLMGVFVNAQKIINVQLKEQKSGVPIPCVRSEISSSNIDTVVFSNDLGVLSFKVWEVSKIKITFEHSSYYYSSIRLKSDTIDSLIVVYLNSMMNREFDSDEEIDDSFDFNLFGLYFSPNFNSITSPFKYNFSFFLYAFEPKIYLNRFQYLGFKFVPIDFSWNRLSDSVSYTTSPSYKERFFSLSTGLYIYNRFILSYDKTQNQRGLFVDLGVGYRFPYLFNYSYFANSYTKTTIRHIHNYKDFEAFARVGYNAFSIICRYRFFDVLENPYASPPKLSIGIETPFPTN